MLGNVDGLLGGVKGIVHLSWTTAVAGALWTGAR